MGFLNSLFRRNQSSDVLVKEAQSCIQSGNHKKALSLCDKAINIDEKCYVRISEIVDHPFRK
jgi:hypothetical protein